MLGSRVRVLSIAWAGAVKNPTKQRCAGIVIRPLKFKTKHSPTKHCGVQHIRAVCNNNDGDWCCVSCELINLFNKHIHAGTVLMVRLCLTAAGREIISFINNQILGQPCSPWFWSANAPVSLDESSPTYPPPRMSDGV